MPAATYPTFNDWNTVSQYYGADVASMLQQNNVPLSQVGQTIQNAAPTIFQGGSTPAAGYRSWDMVPASQSQFGTGGLGVGTAPGAGGSNLAQALGQFFGGQQQQQQGPNFDPTQNPNYPTSLLGAQALRAVGLNPSNTATINPTPANTPSSSQFAKSGVSAVASPMTASIAGIPMPQTTVGSVFNPAPGTPYQPSQQPYIPPAQQPTGATVGPGRRWGVIPPVAPGPPNTMPPPAPTGIPGGIPPAAANYTAGVPSGYGPNPTRPGLISWPKT